MYITIRTAAVYESFSISVNESAVFSFSSLTFTLSFFFFILFFFFFTLKRKFYELFVFVSLFSITKPISVNSINNSWKQVFFSF